MEKRIVQLSSADYKIVAILAHELWPDYSILELEQEYINILESPNNTVFVCYMDSLPIAFTQLQLRFDYVEGTRTSPVAYIEGIYVKKEYRRQGIAKELLHECELWGKEKECTELASDCELDNDLSFEFHLDSGFKEVNRIICFTKNIIG